MANQRDIAIKIEGVSKEYKIGREKDASLRGTLTNLFKSGKANTETFHALTDINLEIERGDIVGIIGRNGAGKSTLLKILSQITKPTKGRIEINGRVASLLEVGTGFHPELTGRENIYLNGTILGMTRKEVKAKFNDIVEFSGVEKFIDTPVKRYSSGMYVRLAFAVAAHLDPEILIIDEVLAVGDTEFQKKCLGKMKDVASEGRTVLFVSHNMGAVKNLCNKGVLIEKGKITKIGEIETVIQFYNEKHLSSLERVIDTSDYTARPRGVKHIFFTQLELNKTQLSPSDDLVITATLKSNENQLSSLNFDIALFVFDEYQNVIIHVGTEFLIDRLYFSESSNYAITIPNIGLNSGQYSIGLWAGINRIEQDYIENKIHFEIFPDTIYPIKTARVLGVIQKEFKIETLNNA